MDGHPPENPIDRWVSKIQSGNTARRDDYADSIEAGDIGEGSHTALDRTASRRPTFSSAHHASHYGLDSEHDGFSHTRQHTLPSVATGPFDTPEDEPGPKPLRRELEAIHIFMIAISTVIGVGYYIRTGIILRIGGPAAVVYSYVFLGVLTLMVTRNLAVMLRIWPVAGALTLFVEKFVDKEVGTAVAIMYWLSFSFSFASLTTAIGDLVDDLEAGTGGTVVVTILSLVVPIVLNLTDIRVFRWIEFFFGTVKLTLALCIIIVMNIMNPDVGDMTGTDVRPREVMFQYDHDQSSGWFASISASVFLASFSILGIEIVAAAAQEANFETTPSRKRSPLDEGNELASMSEHHRGRSVASVEHGRASRGSSLRDGSEDPPPVLNINKKDPFAYAMWIPTVVTIVYVWGGWIVSQNIRWDDDRLPTLKWGADLPEDASISPFINSAADSKFKKHLPTAMASLLVLHVVSTSSSVLYVAARTLFGFAYTTSVKLEGRRRTWKYRIVSKLAFKNKFDVPYVAVLVSAWLFWLPFLKYTSRKSFNSAVNVITEMASVACVLVWALESLAAFRFYRCYKKLHRDTPSVRQEIMTIAKVDDTSWYNMHLISSMLSVVLCLVIVLVGGTMTLLLNLDPLQGVAAFSIILVFFLLTLALKWDRGGRAAMWSWGTDLSVGVNLTDIFTDLDDQKKHNLERQERAPMTVWDLGGCVNSEWISRRFRR